MVIVRLISRSAAMPGIVLALVVAAAMAVPESGHSITRFLAAHHAVIAAGLRDAAAAVLTAAAAGILLVLRGRVAAHQGLHAPQPGAHRADRQRPPAYRQSAWRDVPGHAPVPGQDDDPVAVLNGTLREPGKGEL